MENMILYSNYDLGDSYDEMKEYLKEEYPDRYSCDDDDAVCEPSDSDIWDEIYEQDRNDFEEFYSSTKSYFSDKTVIFVGVIGRWDGTYNGGKIGTFEELYAKGLQDCGFVEVSENEDGQLFIKGSHHDGNVNYEVKILTQKGAEIVDDWEYDFETEETEEQLHKRLMESSEYTTFPFLGNNIY